MATSSAASGGGTASSSSSSSPPVLARLLLPDDANPAGNVHGGTIIQMMEQAGMIAATRHCNSSSPPPPCEGGGDREGTTDRRLRDGTKIAGLARFETMSFHEPMYVGEVASLTADIVFTSERSVLVKVVVTGENPATGKKRVTNTGELWYICFVVPPDGKGGEEEGGEPLLAEVPQVEAPSEENEPGTREYARAKRLYEARKEERRHSEDPSAAAAAAVEAEKGYGACLKVDNCLCPDPDCRSSYASSNSPSDGTPSDSKQTLCQMVLPGDCGLSKVAFGGFVMKLMDTAAGCCAARHCRTNVVTVSISAMDLTGFVKLGNLVTITAIATFNSAKSLEIEVEARVSSFVRKDALVAKGTFTFVSLSKEGRVAPIPKLRLESKEEFQRAFESQRRYEVAKRERLARKQKN